MVASIKVITIYDIQYIIYDMLHNVFIHYDMICMYMRYWVNWYDMVWNVNKDKTCLP